MVAEAISTVISRRKLTMGIVLGAALTPRTVPDAAGQDATPATMSVDETGKVLNNYLTALLGGGDVGHYLADNVVVRFMDVGQDVSGREEVAAGLHALHGEQFEAQPELVGMIVGEGVVAVEATFIGTHTGEFGGIPPSGTSVSVPYAVFLTLAGGVISELHLYDLISGLMMKLAETGTPEPSASVA
jgi:predicted ester cyclase